MNHIQDRSIITGPQARLIQLGEHFNVRDFVETGTQQGNTFRAMKGHFARRFTIDIHGQELVVEELSENSFAFKGSSGDLLGGILQKHNIIRALFWLDAHGPQTFYVDDGNNQVPKELEAVAQYAPDSLIVIDDITEARGTVWINDSYKLVIPNSWTAEIFLSQRCAVLHRGGYVLPPFKDKR